MKDQRKVLHNFRIMQYLGMNILARHCSYSRKDLKHDYDPNVQKSAST